MALSADAPVKRETGDFNEFDVAASTTIYEGSMVGDNASGYARALTAGDPFLGHADEKVDNSSGAAAAERVRVLGPERYRLEVTLASVAITDVGKNVYASDDATVTLTQGSNSYVGQVARYVTTNTCVVEFHPQGADLPNHEHTATTDGGELTSPHVITDISDTNGNELIKVTATASAVNEVTLANAATGNDPVLSASGETNVGITLKGKGTGIIAVGVDDTGHDVKFFGATAGSYLLWDESADKLIVNAGTADLGTSCEADAYTVGGAAGVDFGPSDITTITVVKGIVTAIA